MLNIQVFPVFLREKSALRISVICNQFEYKSHLYFLKLPMEIGSKSKSRHKFNFSSLMGQIFHSESKCSKCPQISLRVVVLSLCFCPTTCPLFSSQSFQGWIKGSTSSQIFSHFPERTGFSLLVALRHPILWSRAQTRNRSVEVAEFGGDGWDDERKLFIFFLSL